MEVSNVLLLQEEEKTKPRLAKSDPREIQKYYQNFYEKNIKEGQYTKKPWGLVLIKDLLNTTRDVTLSNYLFILLFNFMLYLKWGDGKDLSDCDGFVRCA